MQEFFNNAISGVGVTDIIDILIVAFVAYKLLGFIRDSRAGQLVKGLLFLVIATILSDLFNLYALHWLLKSTISLGIIALVIVFQPELRRVLEQMGRSQIVKFRIGDIQKDQAKRIIGEFVVAIEDLATEKTGALIVIEGENPLVEISETGTFLKSEITSELLKNIFYPGSPLHDGAVIIQGDKILAAGCVLPLTENNGLPTELGTRHRAGIGISEQTDAMVFIVSEETGIISYAHKGKLERYIDEKSVEKILLQAYRETKSDPTPPGFFFKKKKTKNKEGDHAE